MKSFSVIFTYSFCDDASVYLFDTIEEAKKFLKESYKEELRIDKEENGRESIGFINKMETFASISSSPTWQDEDDITMIHIGRVYE